jgi:hypothetical protein
VGGNNTNAGTTYRYTNKIGNYGATEPGINRKYSKDYGDGARESEVGACEAGSADEKEKNVTNYSFFIPFDFRAVMPVSCLSFSYYHQHIIIIHMGNTIFIGLVMH